MKIAQIIDHTILKPGTLRGEIEKICAEALQYGFASVCIPPLFVREARKIMKEGKVCTVIGFPFGYSNAISKREEIKRAGEEGADEVDMVINYTALKNGNMDILREEIEIISGETKSRGLLLKLILETGSLTEEEIIKCCQLYQGYPVQFLKTSTGYAEKGASVEAVKTLRNNLPAHIGVKASGGIRDRETALKMIEAGANRLGCSASVAIITNEKAETTY